MDEVSDPELWMVSHHGLEGNSMEVDETEPQDFPMMKLVTSFFLQPAELPVSNGRPKA